MPAFVAAAALAGALGGITVTAGAVAFAGFAWGAFATSLVIGGLSKLLQKSPKNPNAANFQAQGRVITLRQAASSWQVVVGETRVGGDMTFIHSRDDNQTLLLVITFAGHPCQEIVDIYFNDELVTLSHVVDNKYIGTGKWASKVVIWPSLGDEGDAQPFTTEWCDLTEGKWLEAEHKQQGFTKIAVDLEHDSTLFSGGIPNITALIKGIKLYDPRSDTTKWTPNVALATSGYITEQRFGLAADYDTEIDESDLVASANVCEERVLFEDYQKSFTADAALNSILLAEGSRALITGDGVRFSASSSLPAPLVVGTTYYACRASNGRYKLATTYANALAGTTIDLTSVGAGDLAVHYWDEARYGAHGAFRVNVAPRDVITDLLPSMAGKAINVGGMWHILAGMFDSPSIVLDEGDLSGPIEVQSLVSRKENCNAVKGLFVDPSALWQPQDFPGIASDSYMAEDNGERVWRDIDLTAFTQSSSTSQRLAKIELLRTRQALTVSMVCKLSAYRVQTGRVVAVNNVKFGWSEKHFEVTNSRFNIEADGQLGVILSLRETGAAIYDWATSEEQLGDLLPNTTLPAPFTVTSTIEDESLPGTVIIPGTMPGDRVAPNSLAQSALLNALSTRIDLIDASALIAGSVNARIATEATTRQTQDSSLASSISTVSAGVAGNAAAISTETTARVNADTALSSSITTVAASASSNTAAIATEATARANADSAISTSLTTTQSTVAGHTAAIATEATTRASVDGGLLAQYTVKVDVNGHVAGFGLASNANNSTPFSEFIVLADRFAIVHPTGGTAPFFVEGGIVYIDNARIRTGDITTLKVAANAITNGTSGVSSIEEGDADGVIEVGPLGLTTNGGIVDIVVSFNWSVNYPTTPAPGSVEIFQDGVLVAGGKTSIPQVSQTTHDEGGTNYTRGGGTATVMARVIPSTGSHTYMGRITMPMPLTVFNKGIFITERKR